MAFLKTIGRDAALEGFGVHSGKPARVVIRASDAGEIAFVRPDLGGAQGRLAEAGFEARNSTALLWPLFRVSTVEHLLAALSAAGIGSAVLSLEADEIPILDGSAAPFVRALGEAGTRDLAAPVRRLRVVRPFAVSEGDASIVVEPPAGAGDALDLIYTIDYPHPAIGRLTRALRLAPADFAREIAPARTFGFLADVEELHRRGLALGASRENTVVLDDAGVVGGPLRFPDEFVRHKLLDLTGDLALLGRPLAARVTAFKAGHRLHLEAVKFLRAHPDFAESY